MTAVEDLVKTVEVRAEEKEIDLPFMHISEVSDVRTQPQKTLSGDVIDYDFDVTKKRCLIFVDPDNITVEVRLRDIVKGSDVEEYDDMNLDEDSVKAFNFSLDDGIAGKKVVVKAQQNSNGILVINVFGISGQKAVEAVNEAALDIGHNIVSSYFMLNALYKDIVQEITVLHEEWKIKRDGIEEGRSNTVKLIEKYVAETISLYSGYGNIDGNVILSYQSKATIKNYKA